MSAIDGNLDDNEKKQIVHEVASFGLDLNEATDIFNRAGDMTPAEAIGIVDNLTDEQKKYAAGFIATICLADGKVADNENKLWWAICYFARIYAGVEEVIKFYNEH